MATFSAQIFTNFLREIDPTSTYTIVQLTGGLTNWTVRAIKQSSSENTGIFAEHHSVIIKYAPPFRAGNEKDKLPIFRQAVESEALTFLENTSIFWQEDHGIEVPSVLYWDREQCMLVITDLGDDLTTLDRWLDTNPGTDAVTSVAQRLGKFLAAMQKLSITDSALDSPDMDIGDFAREGAVDRVKHALGILNIEDDEACELSEMVRREMETESHEGASFAMGDLCPFNILICPWGERVAVIDFEFAGRAHALQDVIKLGTLTLGFRVFISPLKGRCSVPL
ncbi:hypothetical protein L218DRAFT_236219 [Marasmius fiardii PR-910]|nr:hypothetical protein L218DRAFT_236219 [Marasmius fiardii PR-910]